MRKPGSSSFTLKGKTFTFRTRATIKPNEIPIGPDRRKTWRQLRALIKSLLTPKGHIATKRRAQRAK